MVFSGRPSKACQQCRNRRLKCDLRKETCSQCKRAHLICSGYRDVDQLRIRDQSQATIKKALRKRPTQSQAIITFPKPLLPSIEQRAQGAFFERYVVGNFKTYDYLQSFYASTSIDEHLSSSLDAVSLAYLSHQQSLPVILEKARQKYVYALNLTNAALQSPDTASRDSTLLATLLLDLFEKFTSDKPQSKGAWTSHVNGALALVGMRGTAQFSTPIGLRMAVRLITSILISFVACETAVPKELLEIKKHAARFVNVSDPKWRLMDLMAHYASFSADVRAGKLTDMRVVSLAVELDAKFLDIMTTMPPSWHYETIPVTSGRDGAFEDFYCRYPSQHVTQTWNVIRIIRILLSDAIRNHVLKLLDSVATTDLVEHSVALTTAIHSLQTLSAEICASGPQYLGSLEVSRKGNSEHSTPLSDWSQASLQCYILIFPFYIAARYAPDSSVKNWVIKQLQCMSSNFGIRNAHLVAELLERGEDVNPWLVYVMLGSYAFAA